MADDDEKRLQRLEQRVLRLEKNIFIFQAHVAKKLTEALQVLQGRQQAREKRVGDSLRKLAGELGEIRDKLGAVAKPPKVTH